MVLVLPDPSISKVDDIRAFLREADVDSVCIRNTNEMMKRYQMVAPLLNKKYGEPIDSVSLIAFRCTFESVIV